jgi:hypothetical protein
MQDEIAEANGLHFNSPSQFLSDPEGYACSVIRCIPTMSAQDLDATARQAFKIEGVGFIIRMLCVVRLVHLAQPQSGGRGNRDAEGKGVTATVRQLAREWKLTLSTLQTDRAIYRVFFAEQVDTADFDFLRLCGLGREYFRIALSAVEPKQAIEVALERHRQGGYSIRQFVADVAEMPRRVKGIGSKQGIKIVLDQETAQMLDKKLELMRSEHPQACSSRARFVRFLLEESEGRLMEPSSSSTTVQRGRQ